MGSAKLLINNEWVDSKNLIDKPKNPYRRKDLLEKINRLK